MPYGTLGTIRLSIASKQYNFLFISSFVFSAGYSIYDSVTMIALLPYKGRSTV